LATAAEGSAVADFSLMIGGSDLLLLLRTLCNKQAIGRWRLAVGKCFPHLSQWK
jgi:hypothetical protein